MKPTSKRLLAVIALVGGVCSLSLSRILVAAGDSLLEVHASTPAAIAIMTLALLWWTLIVRRRLTHIARARHEAQRKAAGSQAAPFIMREKPLEPIVAARTVALAFASSRAGSYVLGWYVGVAASFLGHLGSADVRVRLGYSVLSAALSFALVAVAVWLERSCQLPPPPPGAEASPA